VGASGWMYFVRYQPDIQKALQELREEVFQRGDYYKQEPYWRQLTFEQYLPPVDLSDEEREAYRESFQQQQALPDPTSIETLLEWNGEEGTHSILDVNTIVDTPLEPPTLAEWQSRCCPPGETRFAETQNYILRVYGSQIGKVYPLSEQQLERVFGTTQPTREMVERHQNECHELRDRGVGLYIIVYQDGFPDEIFFAGYSGD